MGKEGDVCKFLCELIALRYSNIDLTVNKAPKFHLSF